VAVLLTVVGSIVEEKVTTSVFSLKYETHGVKTRWRTLRKASLETGGLSTEAGFMNDSIRESRGLEYI